MVKTCASDELREWIIASSSKPLTEEAAEIVVSAYQTIQELIARISEPERRQGPSSRRNHRSDSAPCCPKITMHMTAVAKTNVNAV
jgi:hypothetical protein